MPDATLPAPAPPWQAELALRFGLRAGRTEQVEARHRGPLRVQRALQPGDGGCESLILHPPGGLAGGDSLTIRIEAEPGARVLLSTPGASKWYRSAGRAAHQQVQLQVGCGAMLEWLPQEAILFTGADAIQSLEIALARDATTLGWDLVQLGRIAAGDGWDSGRLRQSLTLRRDGLQVWHEHADLDAADPLRQLDAGLAGRCVFGTLWAAAPTLAAQPDAALTRVRDALAAADAGMGLQSDRHSAQSSLCAAATWLAAPAELLLVRAIDSDAERLRHCLEAAWHALRPLCGGRAARRPRIWAT